ncbi:hypothetical protein CapIbe_021883 [Capra ibex]
MAIRHLEQSSPSVGSPRGWVVASPGLSDDGRVKASSSAGNAQAWPCLARQVSSDLLVEGNDDTSCINDTAPANQEPIFPPKGAKSSLAIPGQWGRRPSVERGARPGRGLDRVSGKTAPGRPGVCAPVDPFPPLAHCASSPRRSRARTPRRRQRRPKEPVAVPAETAPSDWKRTSIYSGETTLQNLHVKELKSPAKSYVSGGGSGQIRLQPQPTVSLQPDERS